MCDNYLLIFLGLRSSNKFESNNTFLPWKKTKRYFNSFFYRNRIGNVDNYIKETDIMRCVTNHKNSQTLQTLEQNQDHSTDSPIQIISSNSPIGQNNLQTSINRNYIQNSERHLNNNKSPIIPILSWIYSLIILLLLATPVLLYIHKFNKDGIYHFPYILFYLIYPIQYIFSILYYSDDHYDRLIHKWDTSYIKRDKLVLSKKDVSAIIIIFVSFIISIATLILAVNDKYSSEYKEYIDKNLLYTLLFFEWVYGRTLLLYNLFVFFFTFHTHLEDMQKNVDFLTKSNWIFYKDTKRISDICISIIINKFELEESITKLQNIFSSSTILGTLAFCLVWLNYKDHGCDYYLGTLCIIYALIQLYFCGIIIFISKQQKSMVESIRHPIFAAHWLQRVKDIYKKNSPSLEKQYISIEENGTSIDWLILNTILQEKWVNFEFFGVPLQDGNLVRRCFGLAVMILGINKVSFDYFNNPTSVIQP